MSEDKLTKRCACGTYLAIQHICVYNTVVPGGGLKPGTRPANPGPRCIGCNTLHGQMEHICAARDALLAKKFVDEPATLGIAQAQWAQGWRPKGMCLNCPKLEKPCKQCYVRAGYKAENYERAFA